MVRLVGSKRIVFHPVSRFVHSVPTSVDVARRRRKGTRSCGAGRATDNQFVPVSDKQSRKDDAHISAGIRVSTPEESPLDSHVEVVSSTKDARRVESLEREYRYESDLREANAAKLASLATEVAGIKTNISAIFDAIERLGNKGSWNWAAIVTGVALLLATVTAVGRSYVEPINMEVTMLKDQNDKRQVKVNDFIEKYYATEFELQYSRGQQDKQLEYQNRDIAALNETPKIVVVNSGRITKLEQDMAALSAARKSLEEK